MISLGKGDKIAVSENGVTQLRYPSYFKAKILCKNHNEILTHFDQEALRLFKSFKSIDDSLTGKKAGLDYFIFAGEDIERWLLKLSCGSLLVDKEIDHVYPEWISILFQNQKMPKGWGMYYAGNQVHFENLMGKVVPYRNRAGKIDATEIRIHNHRFILSLSDESFQFHRATYRPKRLKFLKEGVMKQIEFCWQDSENHLDIPILR